MRIKTSIHFFLLLFLLLFCLDSQTLAAKKKVEWVGREVGDFTLPSNQDRVISYVEEYYGKHHLIMTFFPAAFTPV